MKKIVKNAKKEKFNYTALEKLSFLGPSKSKKLLPELVEKALKNPTRE